MDSDSAILLSSPPPSAALPPPSSSPTAEAPPSAKENGPAAANGESSEPEDYETASDPEVDHPNFAGCDEESLLLEKASVSISPATRGQNPVSADEVEVDDLNRNGIFGGNFDLSENSKDRVLGVWETKEEELKLASLMQNATEGQDFGWGEVSKSAVENRVGESRIENDEKLGGDRLEEANNLVAGGSREDDTAVETKPVEVESISGDGDYIASLNQNALFGGELKSVESEAAFNAVATNEVGAAGNACVKGLDVAGKEIEKSAEHADSDVLRHDHAVAPDVDAAHKDEPPADVNTGESIDNGDEVEAVVKANGKIIILGELGAIDDAESKRCTEVVDPLNAKVSDLDSFESNAEGSVVEKVEGEVDSTMPEVSKVDYDVSKGTTVKRDAVNYTESSEGGTSLIKDVGDEKFIVGSEHASSPGVAELAMPSERSAPLTQEIGDGKFVVGSEHASSPGEPEPTIPLDLDCEMNSAQVVEAIPGIDKVTASGDENTEKITTESLPQVTELDQKVELDADVPQAAAEGEKDVLDEDEEGRISDGPARVAILDSSEAAKHIIREMERMSSSSHSVLQGYPNFSSNVDGQIISDSDEAVDSDEDGDGGELFDSDALAALLKAATGASDGTVTVTSQDAARIFSVDRPAGLGSSAPTLRPSAPRSIRPSLFTPIELAAAGEPDQTMDDEEKMLHEKVEQIRVKFLRLVHKLGHSPEDTVAAQVLYRLSLAEGIRRGRQMTHSRGIESTKKKALQLEEEGKGDLDFSCIILVLGKTGVGKSATINSIFGEERSHTDPFQFATTSVREISGVVDGVRIRVIDTPGLKASIMDQATNKKILSSIKMYTKRCPPDIVLYVDRVDTQTRDFNDLPLLRSITSILGSSIWFNAIVALTHASSAPPDGPNGSPLGYEVFIAQRSHVVQQSIRQAAGDMRLMNPVALVENHPSCRRNREGEMVLPNGLSWRPQLLLLCYSSKILSEANSLLKLQDPSPGKLFGFRLRSPPLPFLLSSLLQSRAHPKLSGDQGGDNADSDVELDDFTNAEHDEGEDEYDQLPPFNPLRRAQIAKLTKEQRRAYFDEYDYRVKLLQKKQWKEELRRLKEIKKKWKDTPNEFTQGGTPEDYDQDGSPAAVQVPLPDMVLPPSFECDNPAYRYRFLEPTSQLLTRPVLDTHGWDHDCGYDGVSIEESLAIAGLFPTSLAVQITKDKKEFNIHLDSSVAVKHGENGSTLAGFDIQSVGKQLAYIFRGETKFKNMKKNNTAAGISVTILGETIATGLKLEDRISIGKRVGLVASTGAVHAQGDVAYGANLEARLRDKDYPFGQALSTLGLSLMKWRGDLALGANLQSQFSVGRNSKMAIRVGLNNKLTGQITVRTSTSEQLQIALAGVLPLAVSIYRSIRPGESYLDH